MSKTIKLAIADTLEDLSKQDFEKFCHQLLDRREEPRVRRCRVEGKNFLDITDVLVSTFTEAGALRVALEILRRIDCNHEAQSLETLEDLSKQNFEKFCHQLLDRREGPRVRRNRVEGKNFLDVADVVVSTFTEAKAVGVVMDILRQIDCNEDAESLAKLAGVQSGDAAGSGGATGNNTRAEGGCSKVCVLYKCIIVCHHKLASSASEKDELQRASRAQSVASLNVRHAFSQFMPTRFKRFNNSITYTASTRGKFIVKTATDRSLKPEEVPAAAWVSSEESEEDVTSSEDLSESQERPGEEFHGVQEMGK
ncbi:Apoptosis-associated speck-like protein containing a CARD PYD and CARD domain-containing protein [Channa argus]|uniref:Apoptosis-associated speck-like protein containing a CARD PYD and CARD domain-containing protein n=1 Tax=Channa argus TaxID=215402 RepID=A0A6G1PQK2_CHAAH|nr:Apoptosis-associated speck-like protein containing a CARD PYD and CARD domain-containing protein [Channa argus]